jgi:signal transduction histidine kinase
MAGIMTTPLEPGGWLRMRSRWSWVAGRTVDAARGLALGCMGALPGFALVLFVILVGRSSAPGGQGHHSLRFAAALFLLSGVALGVRRLPSLARTLAGRWCSTPIPVPYRPRPQDADDTSVVRFARRAHWIATDPATWRDAAWTWVNACGGFLLAALPGILLGTGIVTAFVIVPHILLTQNSGRVFAAALTTLVSLGLAAFGLRIAQPMLRTYGSLASSLLGPTRETHLTDQVQHLALSRSETIDAGAAQIRRIERDLHDGAQARLVAMGMTLDIAEQLVDINPDATRKLLAEARESSAKALAELRNLVRGIHPPVLADRGLPEALRALALDSPVRARLDGGLPGRPPAPIESAAYFAVSELLANVSKHARASHALIDVRYERGSLRIGVSDDGIGGADPSRGTGLCGIERRIAAFDGVMAVSSPPGGPTVVNLEIPCELLSPKIFSC